MNNYDERGFAFPAKVAPSYKYQTHCNIDVASHQIAWELTFYLRVFEFQLRANSKPVVLWDVFGVDWEGIWGLKAPSPCLIKPPHNALHCCQLMYQAGTRSMQTVARNYCICGSQQALLSGHGAMHSTLVVFSYVFVHRRGRMVIWSITIAMSICVKGYSQSSSSRYRCIYAVWKSPPHSVSTADSRCLSDGKSWGNQCLWYNILHTFLSRSRSCHALHVLAICTIVRMSRRCTTSSKSSGWLFFNRYWWSTSGSGLWIRITHWYVYLKVKEYK